MKVYIEDWSKLNINNESQLSCTMFLSKYWSLDLYDEDVKKRLIVDDEELQFDKNDELTVIGITNEPNGWMYYHEYFCTYDDLFDIFQ